MNRVITLDTLEINKLIRELSDFKDHMGEELVNILCIEGAEQASMAYGSMASADGGVVSAEEGSVKGQIIATSENEDKLLIAEFGAGDATLEDYGDYFPEAQGLEWVVFRGAYSLFKGTRQYWRYGAWNFPPGSYNWLTEVKPRQGLYAAKQFVLQNYERLAEEVIRFD